MPLPRDGRNWSKGQTDNTPLQMTIRTTGLVSREGLKWVRQKMDDRCHKIQKKNLQTNKQNQQGRKINWKFYLLVFVDNASVNVLSLLWRFTYQKLFRSTS